MSMTLEENLTTLPTLISEKAVEVAKARRLVEQTKMELEVVESKGNLSVRRAPPAGLKVTESSVEEVTKSSSLYANACTAYHDALLEYEILKAELEGLRNNFEACKLLIQNHG